MAKENCIISLQNVCKVFDGVTVVDNFNLDITKGEFVTFLGPSGCGKTTTLRMIAGFDTPSSGAILLNGEDITKIPPYKRPINTVFQRYALFPYLDVYDNVAFGLKLKTKTVPIYSKLTGKQIKVIDFKQIKALQNEIALIKKTYFTDPAAKEIIDRIENIKENPVVVDFVKGQEIKKVDKAALKAAKLEFKQLIAKYKADGINPCAEDIKEREVKISSLWHKPSVGLTKKVHLSKEEIDKKVMRALKIIDLEDLESRDISTLSGGQQQRVAIARAIVNEPEILLLDEPLGALDLKMRKEMQLELKEMHKKLGITFIYVTHDQEEALTMSDTIVVMKNGEIQQVGSPADIYNEPNNAYVANFIGESNIYNATMVDKKKVKFLGHIFRCEDNFPINEKVDVVIRPEDVELALAKKDDKQHRLVGKIATKIFKGIHYEYTVLVGKSEVIVQTTKNREVGDEVYLDVAPENIQIMKKEMTSNTYAEAWINKNNQVVISDEPFDVDVTTLLPKSKLDEEGYLIGPDGKVYDLNDAGVIATVGFGDIEFIDGYDNGQLNAVIVSSIYKGDHYQVIARTTEDEDFIIDTQDAWNVADLISIKIDPKAISLTLKGDIKKYEKKED